MLLDLYDDEAEIRVLLHDQPRFVPTDQTRTEVTPLTPSINWTRSYYAQVCTKGPG